MRDTHLRVIYSQDIEALCEVLTEDFFSPGSRVFESRLVVVPHLGIKEFLVQFLASHPRLTIATGLKILPLHQAVMEMADRIDVDRQLKKIPSLLEISLAIQEQLLSLDPDQIKDPAFKDYFHAKTLSSQKVTALSKELAKLFTRYGLFGEQFLPVWLEKKGWQQEIWSAVFKQWTYPLEFFSLFKNRCFSGKIALLGFSYIPSVHLRFFASLNASCYLFSPCSLFWEDLVSDQERLNLDRKALKKGVSVPVREQLNRYMKQNHPLLANWGKMGKQMARVLQGQVLEESEHYLIPASDRLLCSVQRSILTFDESEILKSDDSIQVHSASSRLREVEEVRDVLETLMQKHQEEGHPILPEQILVVAPDISIYAPLIHKVFSASSLPFSVESKGCMPGQVAGFLALINLPKQRYSLQSVMELLTCQSFRKRASLLAEDVDTLHSWFKSAHILFDLQGNPKSWQEGLDRLLYGLGLIPSDGDITLSCWPIPCIPHSDIDLFSRFLELFTQMQQDLIQLELKRSLCEWLTLFLQIREQYFVNEEDSRSFFAELLSLKKSFITSSAVWSFEDVYPLLQSLSEKSQEKSSLSSIGHILFSSLDKTPLKPAKIIWCLGLDEESFPRVEIGSSLCAMQKGMDEFPSKSDQDRFVFLEMVMKAKEYLIFSYERIDLRDAKEKGASLLVEELNSYIISRGVEEGLERTRHPCFVFDETYFSSLSVVKRWSRSDYLAASAYYSSPEPQKSFFTSSPATELSVITVAQLKKCARHPLQLYFNETLQLFLKDEENEEEEEFVLSALKKSMLRKEGCQKKISSLTHRIKAEGKLPLGGWKDVALYELEEEIQGIVDCLKQFNVLQEEITSVHFVDCLETESSFNLETAVSKFNTRPLLCVGSWKIQGELEGITPQGLLFHGTSDLADLIKVWPLYLIYLQLYPQTPYLLLTKEGTQFSLPVANPALALQSYLNFYVNALQTPCPLVTSSVKVFLEGDLSAFRGSLEKENEDPYWNYLKRRGAVHELEPFFSFWQPILRDLFGEIHETV